MDTSNDSATLRVAPRVPAPETVWLSCRREAATGTELANGLLDLSPGGLQFLSRELLETGDVLSVVIAGSAHPAPLRRGGEVRWRVELGGGACCAGLRFMEPLPDDVVDALFAVPAAASESEQFLFD